MDKRCISLLCALALLLSLFPTETLAAETTRKSEYEYRMYVPSTYYEEWMRRHYIDDSGVDHNLEWELNTNGSAVVTYRYQFDPVHPQVQNPGVLDSGLNDAGRDRYAEENRIRGSFWETTEDGVVDLESGQDDPFEGYNFGIDRETATLYLNDAYLRGSSNGNVSVTLDVKGNLKDVFVGYNIGDTLTIELEGENQIAAPPENGSRAAILFSNGTESAGGDYLPAEANLLLTGEGSLEVLGGRDASHSAYGIAVVGGDLTVTGGARATVRTQIANADEAVAIRADQVLIEDESTLSVDLTANSQGIGFVADAVTVENGGTLNVSIGDGCTLVEQSSDEESADNMEFLIEKGGTLNLSVENGAQADLTMLNLEDSDLSQSVFDVEGLLLLPDELNATELEFSGSGTVFWQDETYVVTEDGKLELSEQITVMNDIVVDVGGQTVEDGSGGYTWTTDGEGTWTLKLLTRNVLGDIIINQNALTDEGYDDEGYLKIIYNLEEKDRSEDTRIEVITEGASCTVFGDLTVNTGAHTNIGDVRYRERYGTLAVSGAGVQVQSIEYKYGAVEISGKLTGYKISAWRAHLLSDADLYLTGGISLTVNDCNPQMILSGILYRPPTVGEEGYDEYLEEYQKYEADPEGYAREQILERCRDTFVMEDGAYYSFVPAEGGQRAVRVKVYTPYGGKVSMVLYMEGETPAVGDNVHTGDVDQYGSKYNIVPLIQENLDEIINLPDELSEDVSPHLDSDDYSLRYHYFDLGSGEALYLPEPVEPEIIAGANGTWRKGSESTLSFTSSADFASFLRVEVDGEVVDESNYTVRKGSTIVYLKAAYLETLSVGKHTLSIVSRFGAAETEFTIKSKDGGYDDGYDDGDDDGDDGSGSGGSSGGGSGGSGSSAGTGSSAAPVTVTTGTVKADDSGNAAITKDILSAPAAQVAGVAFVVPVEFGTANRTAYITLSAEALDMLVASGAKRFTIDTDCMADFGFPLETLRELDGRTSGDLILKLEAVAVPAQASAAVGSRPIYDITLWEVKGTTQTQITSLNGKTVSIAIPYTPAEGESTGNLYAVCADGTEDVEWITKSSYDPDQKAVLLEAAHLSIYGVGYKPLSPSFTDINGHWAKEDILFAAGRGLFLDTEESTFGPDTPLTRGMLVTALGRMEGVDPVAYQNGTFTDVEAGAYYAPYVNWAVSKGIVSSTTSTTFAPDSSITREQMAVIMKNYTDKMGYSIPKTLESATFADNAQISSWAQEAVKTMQQAGILSGKTGNRFDPKDNATRAEAAAVLHRFVEVNIDPQTANGWRQNDSGEWSYYQDGRPGRGLMFKDR